MKPINSPQKCMLIKKYHNTHSLTLTQTCIYEKKKNSKERKQKMWKNMNTPHPYTTHTYEKKRIFENEKIYSKKKEKNENNYK